MGSQLYHENNKLAPIQFLRVGVKLQGSKKYGNSFGCIGSQSKSRMSVIKLTE